jgi:1-acyl-sn-glycerol-3-phosphate acyltransferase
VNRLLSEEWSRTGVAVLAAEHRLPIVPIHVTGTHEAMPPGRNWPKLRPFRRRHRVTLTFGRPILPREGEHRTELMERIRIFFAEQGAETTQGKIRPRPVPVTVPEPAPMAVAAAEPAPLTPAA